MRSAVLLAFILITGAFCQTADREAHWREDLQALSAGLKAPGIRVAAGIATRGQKDFADVYPNFDAEITSIARSIPTLTDAEIFLRLMHLMASAHIAHNQMEIPLGMGFLNRLPVDFHWFADGLAITGATAEYSNLLGARIRSIGGKTPEQFLADLAPYISNENETWLRFKSIDLMPARGVLLHFGMIGADGKVPLQVETTHGETLSVALPLALGNVPKIGIAEGLHVPPVLYRSHPNSWYWSQYLPDSQTLFIQYNQCINDSQHHFGDVAKQALADADSHPVKRVVIDLRWNGGGDSTVINPLKNGLASRLKSVGHIYVLMGPGTFSSAVVNAVSLRKDLSATLVGETAGGTPDGYGEVDRLTPDLPAPFKLADFIAGNDPALEAALAAHP